MPGRAPTDHDIHTHLTQRFSPYGFAPRRVPPADLAALFEAARWAPSSYNEQPWRFIVATRDDPVDFDRLLSCLVEGNQAWARHAPVLALGVVARSFQRDGSPNPAAEHDLGLAAASLTFEATARGLHVHQMIGIKPDHARTTFGIPAGFDAKTALAIGYAGDNPALTDELRGRDAQRRPRRALSETVFAGAWGRGWKGATPGPQRAGDAGRGSSGAR
jgi:nitroreductase